MNYLNMFPSCVLSVGLEAVQTTVFDKVTIIQQ